MSYAGAVQAARMAMLLAAVVPLAAQNSVALFHKGATRALILSGRNNHEWRTTTPYLRKLLLDTGRFDVRVNEEPAGMTRETLAAYHVVVLDYNGPRWGEAAESALEDFVKQGRGLVAVHAASWAFSGLPVLGDNHVRTDILEPAWPEYKHIIGGVWSLDDPPTGHAPRHQFTVKIVDREHPITRGMPESFTIDDELYHNMRMEPDVHVLATAFDAATGKDQPILWTVAYGKGRVFHTTLGHDVKAMGTPGFVESFTRGAEWAAGVAP